MSTALLEETKPTFTGSRPVHIPFVSDPYLGLCGADLSNAVWSTRAVDCQECLVLNDAMDIGGN